jgi:hypothetical protein
MGQGSEITFHAQDVVAQADPAVAAVEERGAVVPGIAGGLGVDPPSRRQMVIAVVRVIAGSSATAQDCLAAVAVDRLSNERSIPEC